MSTISASTTSTTAFKVTSDTTGTLVLQTGSTPTTAVTIGSDQVVTFAKTPTSNGSGGVSTNTAYGTSALAANTTGGSNTAFGNGAFASNTEGSSGTAVGSLALNLNTTGSANTGIGQNALGSNTSGADNVAVGTASMLTNSTGVSNAAIGRSALRLNTTGSYNTVLGMDALRSNTTASYNTAVGYLAGNSNITGQQHTFVGRSAGRDSTGNNNTFIGDSSGIVVTTGSNNTIIGRYSGNQGGLDIRTASNYIVLSDGDGNPRQIIDSNGRVTTGVQASSFGQYGQGYSAWANVSSHTMNIADLFPLLPVGGAGMTIMLQIVTQSGANNTSSYYVMAKRNIDQSGWAFSTIASQPSGPTISFSGSANSITLTFSFGAQYGKCMLSVLCAT